MQEYLVTKFDGHLFAIRVEKMMVQADGGVRVVFKVVWRVIINKYVLQSHYFCGIIKKIKFEE